MVCGPVVPPAWHQHQAGSATLHCYSSLIHNGRPPGMGENKARHMHVTSRGNHHTCRAEKGHIANIQQPAWGLRVGSCVSITPVCAWEPCKWDTVMPGEECFLLGIPTMPSVPSLAAITSRSGAAYFILTCIPCNCTCGAGGTTRPWWNTEAALFPR